VFRELCDPDNLIGTNNKILFWFVGVVGDTDYYLHQDLVVRSGCHDPTTNKMLGHFKTDEDAKDARIAYYAKYGIDIVGSVVGSNITKNNLGSRPLDLDI